MEFPMNQRVIVPVVKVKLKNLPKSVIICTCLFCALVFGAFFFILHKIKHLSFFHFGPSDYLLFFHIQIDTWEKWFFVIIYVVFSTICSSMVTEIVLPFVMVQIQDTTKPIPAKKWQIYILIQIYYASWSINTVITTYLYFSQIDIVLTQLIVYNIVSFFTTMHYLHVKKKNYDNTKNYGTIIL